MHDVVPPSIYRDIADVAAFSLEIRDQVRSPEGLSDDLRAELAELGLDAEAIAAKVEAMLGGEA